MTWQKSILLRRYGGNSNILFIIFVLLLKGFQPILADFLAFVTFGAIKNSFHIILTMYKHVPTHDCRD